MPSSYLGCSNSPLHSIDFVWTTRPQQAGDGDAQELPDNVQGVALSQYALYIVSTTSITLVLVHLYIQGVLRASVASLSGSMLGRVAREGLQVARGLRALCGQRQSLWIVPYQRGALKPHLSHLSGTLDFIIIPFARGTRRTRDLAGYFYSYMCRCLACRCPRAGAPGRKGHGHIVIYYTELKAASWGAAAASRQVEKN